MHLLLLSLGCGTATPAPAALLRTDAEPAGENCVTGGTAVSTGTDDDGDGVLSDSEVDHTVFVCNGTDGATGADGEDGEDGATGEDGSSSLVTMTDEPAGGNCAEGGVRVDTGVDDDGDGVLDPEEVDETAYVCDGATGNDTLATVSEEAAGVNCPYGGQRLDSGVDTDGSGTLDAGEVTSTSYVCNGATGDEGAAAMVDTAEEPEGDNCAAGGVAVSVGTDDDGDGALSDAEVDATYYICDGTAGSDGSDGSDGSGGGIAGTIVAGDYTVSNSVEASLLDGVEQITGTLTIYGTSMGDVEIPDVQRVGSLYVGNGSYNFEVDSVSMPSLTTVDDNFTASLVVMPDWSGFDALESVGGTFAISYPRGCTALNGFDALTSVGDQLTIYVGTSYSPPTEIIGFNGLTSLPGGIEITSSGTLTAITGFTLLASADSVTVGGTSTLTDLSGFGNLRTVTDTLYLYNLGVTDLYDFSSLSSVGSLNLSSLASLTDIAGLSGITSTTGSVSLSSLTSLTNLTGLDNLASVGGSLGITGLTSLTSIAALSDLTTVTSSLTLSGLTSLTSLSGLDNLTSVGGTITFTNLSLVTDVDELGDLTSAGGLTITSLTALTNLDGLYRLDIAELGSLYISSNTALTDISGLGNVSGTLQSLVISSNTTLPNVDGLEGITYTGYSSSAYSYNYGLYISGNTALTDLDGLSGLTSLGYGYLYITSNTNLCVSIPTALRTRIGTSNILGNWSASGNKTGC